MDTIRKEFNQDTLRYDETNGNEIMITTYDRILRAWENSMEMVRDYEMYSKRVEEEDVKQVFKKFAEDEGMHASKLREMLLRNKKM
ncbi:MAG: ferritin family protein [Bacillota bacterium]|nr:ferritin family protein [Bacillota bacterium]